MDTDDQPGPEQIEITPTWAHGAVPTLLADQLLITFLGDYYLLTVGVLEHPAIHPSDQKALEELKKRGTLPITPLARFAVPASRMAEWSSVIQGLVGRFTPEKESNDD